jgi:neutral ceramidase
MTGTVRAGAWSVDITPNDSQFLYGYPHVERYSTGIHDPLLSSALYFSDGHTEVLFVANDIIFVSKAMSRRARRRIEKSTGIPVENIMITATHTHSGPIVTDSLSDESDPVVPKADRKYVRRVEDGIVKAARNAYGKAESAQVGLTIADGTGVGTNRRDPAGPADLDVPVLVVKSADGERHIACMLVCSMHPTVLHEDSTWVSGDFPGMAKRYLREHVLGGTCPVIYHTGPAGNQSPRHVTRANTFEEAERLGAVLGRAVEKSMGRIRYTSRTSLKCIRDFVELPRRAFPTVEEAEEKLAKAIQKLRNLRRSAAASQQVRSAECDWFGAEETLTLAKAAAEGRLEAEYKKNQPSEIQIIRVGPWTFVGWPGEVFVEYSLAVKEKFANTFVIALANGELQGYIVTEAAAAEGGYEASNSFFSYRSGQVLVDRTLAMLKAFPD